MRVAVFTKYIKIVGEGVLVWDVGWIMRTTKEKKIFEQTQKKQKNKKGENEKPTTISLKEIKLKIKE